MHYGSAMRKTRCGRKIGSKNLALGVDTYGNVRHNLGMNAIAYLIISVIPVVLAVIAGVGYVNHN